MIDQLCSNSRTNLKPSTSASSSKYVSVWAHVFFMDTSVSIPPPSALYKLIRAI